MVYKSSMPCLLDNANKVVIDNKSKANLLNEYFCSVFTTDDDSQNKWQIDEPDASLETIAVTPVQVHHKLKNLKPKLSCGPDGLPSLLMKKLAHVFDTPLAKIFESSLSTGTVPKKWKEANVTALHKKGDTNKASNYRPISLTCVACRVLESIKLTPLKTINQTEFLKANTDLQQKNRQLHKFLRLMRIG